MAEPAPDCSALLDEELSSFVFSYLTDSQYEVSGGSEEHFYSDFPEIDLSPLDASDLDSASCFSELQWCAERSETESSQYSTDDSELLQIIDSENEALLAALTETLDEIQEDDMGLAAFRAMEERDVPNHICASPAPSPKPVAPTPGGPPLAPEVDELSLLKKLLLSPSPVPPSCEAQREGNARRQGPPKSRPQRPYTKAEGPQDRKLSCLQAQSRSCTELHKHLTSTACCPQTKATWPPDGHQVSGSSHPPLSHAAHSGDDSDSSEDSLSSNEAPVTPPSSSNDGTSDHLASEKAMHTVVKLIRYMHTYCLPPRKLPLRDPADVKHQHCNSPYKRAKPDYPSQTLPLESRTSCTWQTAAGSKKPRATWPEFSILKELLARDLLCDVSKPYRLAKPVYASLVRPHSSKSQGASTQEAESSPGGCKARANMPLEKAELRQSPKAESEAKRETSSPEDATGKHAALSAQQAVGKAGRKQECAIYAVRRSKRLNPELSHWLSFLDEPPPELSAPGEAAESPVKDALASREPALYPDLENFDTEEPATVVEVGGTDERDSGCQNHPTETQTPWLGSPDEGGGCEVDESRRYTPLHETETPTCLTLSLAQTDPPFGKRNFEQALTVELCGTAGLTPPTTPPYKPAEEDLYKPDIPHGSVKEEATITPSTPGPRTLAVAVDVTASRKLTKKHPERTELYAHLSRATVRPSPSEQQGVLKRPFSRSFGDHDYCQVLKPEAMLQGKVLKSWEPQSHVEGEHKRRVPDAHYQELGQATKEGKGEAPWKECSKQLRDQEIRASLTKHFGFLDCTLEDEDTGFCKTPEYDIVFEDSCSESSSPAEEEEEEEEEHCESPLESKLCLRRNPLARSSLHHCSRSRSSSGSSCCRSRSPANRRTFRCEYSKQCQGGDASRDQTEKRRDKAISEGRVVHIRNLSSSMSSSELKKRFEVFGEIVECRVLTRNNRGDKYGFITYQCSEHAALSLKNGASLRKRNEPSFQLSYGGNVWTRYTDLDSNTEESSPAPLKSKYETMDFDSLLQEAQRSLHR
nr:peroxisome proliferator-activated receptor gamma coactivator 1-beta isoform X1 [Pelodiscus sinensis]|eukprot:XP_006138162.1 peroxisome proliferator-activated receptor gamma coactivator 1-beta isoform X1 [Pelodiscus sinensis]